MTKRKENHSMTRSFAWPLIVVSIIVVGLFQLVNIYLGFTAYILLCGLIIFLIHYKYVIQVKNWMVQGVIVLIIGIIILEGVIKQNQYILIMGIYILGIITSIIVNYKILSKNNSKRK